MSEDHVKAGIQKIICSFANTWRQVDCIKRLLISLYRREIFPACLIYHFHYLPTMALRSDTAWFGTQWLEQIIHFDNPSSSWKIIKKLQENESRFSQDEYMSSGLYSESCCIFVCEDVRASTQAIMKVRMQYDYLYPIRIIQLSEMCLEYPIVLKIGVTPGRHLLNHQKKRYAVEARKKSRHWEPYQLLDVHAHQSTSPRSMRTKILTVGFLRGF